MSKVYDYYLEMEGLAQEEAWTQMNTLTDEDLEDMHQTELMREFGRFIEQGVA